VGRDFSAHLCCTRRAVPPAGTGRRRPRNTGDLTTVVTGSAENRRAQILDSFGKET
jgi:hypothetical protein